MPASSPPHAPAQSPDRADADPISDQLQRWLTGDGDHTLGGLVDVFQEKSFALVFVLLLGVSALPLPTGGATHVFDVIVVLAAGQLVLGREQIWIPARWRRLTLGGGRQERFIAGLLKLIRFLERFSRPRLRFLFHHRVSNAVFGLIIIVATLGAFFAPPFSGLDTLPALGGVLVSLGFLLEDILVVAIGLTVGAGGIALEIILGKAAAGAVTKLF